MRYLWTALLLFVVASVALAQEQLVSTYQEIARTDEGAYAQAQLILCNNDPNDPGPNSEDVKGALWTTGEWCESADPNGDFLGGDPNTVGEQDDPNSTDGDWSLGFWAGGYDCLHMHYHVFGSGTGQAKVWNCNLPQKPARPAHAAQWDPSTQAPDPLVAPTPSLTNNRECEELTDGTTFNGDPNGTQWITECEAALGMIYGEIDVCTGDCSSRLSVTAEH